MENSCNESSCCSCSSGCCDSTSESKKTKVNIDFLYLDLTECERCIGTDLILYESLLDISKLLDAAGVELIINKINVNSEELAIKYKFVSSPTIRINGHDIQMEVKENLCKSCGDLCGDEVNCRVFIYQGNEYEVPPKAMIIEGILKEVYGVNQQKNEAVDYILPENLKKFYDAMKLKEI